MFRYLFKISYDGSSFFGWQKQVEQITVQQTIEENLSKIHSLRETNIIDWSSCKRVLFSLGLRRIYQ